MTTSPVPGSASEDSRLARTLVGLYPPSWRRRYQDELLVLLADTGLSARSALSLLAGSAKAWARPAVHLHDSAARMRSSITTVVAAWVALAAGGLIFGQLNEDQALRSATPGHALSHNLYALFTIAAHVSVVVLALGTAPAMLQLIVRSARRRRYRELALLSLPVTASLGFLAVLVLISRAVRTPSHGVGPYWFAALTVLGLLAGAAIVIGPNRVLHRDSPSAPFLTLAMLGTTAAAAIMAIALLATIGDLLALRAWAPTPNPWSESTAATLFYGATVVAAIAVAMTSSLRGVRASLSHGRVPTARRV